MNYNALKQKCKEKGYSASSLVTKLGISKSNITNWKNGGNPSYNILIKMAQTLECSVGYLLGTESEDTKDFCGNSVKIFVNGEEYCLSPLSQKEHKERNIIEENTITRLTQKIENLVTKNKELEIENAQLLAENCSFAKQLSNLKIKNMKGQM